MVAEVTAPYWVSLLQAEECEPYEARWANWSEPVATFCTAFEAVYPKPTKDEWKARWHEDYGKPLIQSRFGLERCVPEIELVEAFRRSAWGARWPDTWGKAPAWMSAWKRAEVPKSLSKVLADIRAMSPTARPWDAIAWHGDDYLFVECKGPKGRGREPFTDAELAFIWGASKVGVPAARFAVLYGDIVYPERT